MEQNMNFKQILARGQRMLDQGNVQDYWQLMSQYSPYAELWVGSSPARTLRAAARTPSRAIICLASGATEPNSNRCSRDS